MAIDSDWARLVAEGQGDPAATRDKQLAALLVHSRQQSIALEQVRQALEAAMEQIEKLNAEIVRLRKQMEADAELLAAVRDTTMAAKIAASGLKWVSGIVVALAGFWWAYFTIKGSGGPPDIGVGP